jgi:hypothetical protein
MTVSRNCSCGATLTVSNIEFSELSIGVYGKVKCPICKRALFSDSMFEKEQGRKP